MVKVTLKGDVREYEAGTTIAEIAKSIGAGLYKAACAGKIDGEAVDLRTPVTKDCSVEILTFDTAEGKHAYWHTTSHIMAQAVQHLFPDAVFAIGPAIENGFYYDMDLPRTLTPEDLEKIEAEMKKIIKQDLPLEKFELDPDEAKDMMAKNNQVYKVELIEEHSGKGEKISFYKQGDFTDLCAGPHLMSTGCVKAVKLLNCTGAYWRADANNKMLQRVYGISFPKASQLDEYVTMLEEAKKRDHRKIGKDLELFTIMEEGPGFPFFLPKGMVLKNLLIDYWREIHREAGYQEISTPIILSRKLWERSGHWDHYQQNMYTTVIDDEDYAIKPMNCPGGILVYKTKLHSYRDLPLRIGELGLVHRHELSGALHGLMRVRCFTQDDAHIFMTPEQIRDEIKGVYKLIDEVYSVFGFKYHVELSTRPENSIGTDEMWEQATDGLQGALDDLGVEINAHSLIRDLGVAHKQMVEVAKALSLNARILVMDEPTAPLTNREIDTLFGIIRMLKERGVAIIYISHRLEEVKEVCDRATIMRDGKNITAVNVADVSIDEIIRYMVGRELKEKFPKIHVPLGEELLRVEHLNAGKQVRDISFTVRAGEILGIAGLVGAGRTETARAIFGMDRKDSGEIYLAGKRVDIRRPLDAIKAGFGFATEDRKDEGLVLTMNVGHNITLATLSDFAHLGKLNLKQERDTVLDYIKRLNIKTPSHLQLARNLSGGNQQKVVLAKWLDANPKVLVFDNPTQGVDVGAKEEIYDIILKLAEAGVAVIVLSSEAQEIIRVCDRTVVMFHGGVQGELVGDEMNEQAIMRLATGGQV